MLTLTQKFGGKTAEVSIMKNMFDQQEIFNPDDKQPFSEAMLFGIGGGIGYGHVYFTFNLQPFLYLGNRNYWEKPVVFHTNILSALGLSYTLLQTNIPLNAEINLNRLLSEYGQCIAWVDEATLPFKNYPEYLKRSRFTSIRIAGIDELSGKYIIDSESFQPFGITAKTLNEARTILPYLNTAVLAIEKKQTPGDLIPAIKEGIKNCCERALHLPEDHGGELYSLQSLKIWEERLANPGRRGWKTLFQGKNVYPVLKAALYGISYNGCAGNANRLLFAEFLQEASEICSIAELSRISDGFSESAQDWERLANLIYPTNDPGFAKCEALFKEKERLFIEKGESALQEIRNLDREIEYFEDQLTKQFPYSKDELFILYDDCASQLRKIYQNEKSLLQSLESCLFFIQ
jgi:hypothetical protein